MGSRGRAGAVSGGTPQLPERGEVRRQRPAEKARTERRPRPKPAAGPGPPRVVPAGLLLPGRTLPCAG